MTEDYDIFLSFKNFDRKGQRTADATLADRVYAKLNESGLKVFFSNASLEERGTSGFKAAIDAALDAARILIAIGTTSSNLESGWVKYEWDSFFADKLSGFKPDGELFVYVRDVPLMALPRALRQCQVISANSGSLDRLVSFVMNALGKESPSRSRAEGLESSAIGLTQADVQQRLQLYAQEHDDVYNIQWEPSEGRFEIELNGSSEWPSENPCNETLLKELAKPWAVRCWYSD